MSTRTATIFEIITDNEELHAELTNIMDARSPSRDANPTQPCYETPFSNIHGTGIGKPNRNSFVECTRII